jgi:hypothetical protein
MHLRYDGPHDRVLVIHPTTRKEIALVKRGEYLPDDAPEEIRADLSRRANWTVVEPDKPPPRGRPTTSKTAKKGSDA